MSSIQSPLSIQKKQQQKHHRVSSVSFNRGNRVSFPHFWLRGIINGYVVLTPSNPRKRGKSSLGVLVEEKDIDEDEKQETTTPSSDEDKKTIHLFCRLRILKSYCQRTTPASDIQQQQQQPDPVKDSTSFSVKSPAIFPVVNGRHGVSMSMVYASTERGVIYKLSLEKMEFEAFASPEPKTVFGSMAVFSDGSLLVSCSQESDDDEQAHSHFLCMSHQREVLGSAGQQPPTSDFMKTLVFREMRISEDNKALFVLAIQKDQVESKTNPIGLYAFDLKTGDLLDSWMDSGAANTFPLMDINDKEDTVFVVQKISPSQGNQKSQTVNIIGWDRDGRKFGVVSEVVFKGCEDVGSFIFDQETQTLFVADYRQQLFDLTQILPTTPASP